STFSVVIRFMSEGGFEFPQSRPRTGEARTHRSDRDVERDGCVLVAEVGPSTEDEHVLLLLRELSNEREQVLHLPLVVEVRVREFGEARSGAAGGHAPQCRRVPPLRTPLV